MRLRVNQPTIGMRRDDVTTLSYVTDTKGRVRHVTLIDPDKQSPQVASDRACVAVEGRTR
ncbi:MAG: hypothetical protein CM15mP3_01910 [Candidatus Poseidoniales archaeon]|nr:MAG: hypothetical protein CM15mP3_01910 [Candidatus Poseidoniales archaeon]